MISAKIGFRNLARNRWRSGLTLGGIALSVAFMVWILGFMEGWMGAMVQGATAVETGQVQVHTRAFAENPRVYRSFPVGRRRSWRPCPGWREWWPFPPG